MTSLRGMRELLLFFTVGAMFSSVVTLALVSKESRLQELKQAAQCLQALAR